MSEDSLYPSEPPREPARDPGRVRKIGVAVVAVLAIAIAAWVFVGRDLVARSPIGKPVATVSPKPLGPVLEHEEELAIDPSIDDARRRDVAKAIDAVLPEMKSCISGSGGQTAVVTIVFAPAGEVREASVVEDAGAQSCIVDAAKKARIHPFLGPPIAARYPVRR